MAVRGGSWSISSPIPPGLVSGFRIIFPAAAAVQHVMSNMSLQKRRPQSPRNHLLEGKWGKSLFLSRHCNSGILNQLHYCNAGDDIKRFRNRSTLMCVCHVVVGGRRWLQRPLCGFSVETGSSVCPTVPLWCVMAAGYFLIQGWSLMFLLLFICPCERWESVMWHSSWCCPW